MFLPESIIVLILCATLSVLAFWLRVLTRWGSIAAFLVGAVIGIMGHISWVVLLLIFFLTSFAATKYKFEVKKARGLQEGKRGERGYKNVVANGAVAVIIAFFSFENELYPYLEKDIASVLFLAAIAVAAADTIASELGILSEKVYLVTTGERVKPGTDGGVSIYGTLWGLVAATYTAFLGYFMLTYFGIIDLGLWVIGLVAYMGFLGCQIDSIIGATLEQKGYVSKLTNNLLSISIGTFITWLVIIWLV